MPSEIWWSLPGPRRFVQRVADDVEEGRSVVLALPKPMADGRWGQRLADARVVRKRDCFRPEELIGSGNPAEFVVRNLFPPDTDFDSAAASTLCDAYERLAEGGVASAHSVALLECPPNWRSWPRWREFLGEWAVASRNKPISSRIVFVAVVGGLPKRELPDDQDSLLVRRWEQATDEADILAYAHVAFADWQAPRLHRRVAASIAASLAIWDTEVVDALVASSDLDQMINPSPILKRLGHERGWSHSELTRSTTWECGQRGSIAAGKVHSAALALCGNHNAIQSRVWAGQVAVLLPFIEERRLDVIETLKGLFTLPWRTGFGEITHERDLEIAHLVEQVDRFRLPLGPDLTAALPVLRQVRNQLAHLESVDSRTLSNESLLRIQNGMTDS